VELGEVADEGVSGPDLASLDRVLARLEARDPTAGEIVNLRFFAGLSIEETARALGLSPATVKREWAYARAWLHHELNETPHA
jgi:DNA-directed RNA polymerase specialized sigma24 family protein